MIETTANPPVPPPTTPIETISSVLEKARAAQAAWATTSPRRRAAALVQVRERLIQRADDWVDLIVSMGGRPRLEALAHELLPAVSTISFLTGRRGRAFLRRQNTPAPILPYRRGYVEARPVGVVAIISDELRSFLLPFRDIIRALACGNAVVLKTGAVSAHVGLRIRDLATEAGLPQNLLTAIVGDARVTASLIQARPNKVLFSGDPTMAGVAAAMAAEKLIPTRLARPGKAAMVVLPDADMDFASSAVVWGSRGYSPSAMDLVLAQETIAPELRKRINEKLKAGGMDGPIVITSYQSVQEAVEKAGAAGPGSAVSLITGDHAQGRRVAELLPVDTVTINETPWGAGRSADAGLQEFVAFRRVYLPRSRLFVFKSPGWFPYSEYQYAAFRTALELFRRHWIDRIRAVPLLLWNAVQLFKREPRI